MKLIKKSISKAEIAAMPKVLFPGRIFVVYTESDAEKAVAYLKDQRIVFTKRCPQNSSKCSLQITSESFIVSFSPN